MLPQERPELIPSEEASNEFVVALECRENDALWRGSETWRTLLKNLVSFFEGAITATFARALDQLPSMQSSKNQSEPHSSSSSSPQIRRERGVTSPRLVDVKSSKQKRNIQEIPQQEQKPKSLPVPSIQRELTQQPKHRQQWPTTTLKTLHSARQEETRDNKLVCLSRSVVDD